MEELINQVTYLGIEEDLRLFMLANGVDRYQFAPQILPDFCNMVIIRLGAALPDDSCLRMSLLGNRVTLPGVMTGVKLLKEEVERVVSKQKALEVFE